MIYIYKFRGKNNCRVTGLRVQLTMLGNTTLYLLGWTSTFTTVSLWFGETLSPFLQGCAINWLFFRQTTEII